MKTSIKIIIVLVVLLILWVFWIYNNKNKTVPDVPNINNQNNNIKLENSENNIDSKTKVVMFDNNLDELVKEKNVLLFFTASWCPTCRALKKDIEKNMDIIPDDMLIVELDYDKETQMKKLYWVTIQHTLIFIDKDKNNILKKVWITRIQSLVDEYKQLLDEWKIIWRTKDIQANEMSDEKQEFKFEKDWLNTNTAKKSIDLKLILDWWPGKDWIPAINNPKFLKISDASDETWLDDETMWISVKVWKEVKFYPYSILYWHEITNDEIWWEKISVTFCPLCWTAIVYDRIVDWEELLFGVSWKLYESNLLMYDDKTHSLWSQSIWEAVVWDMLWKVLNIIKSDLLTYEQFKLNYPDWLIQSTDTWFRRSYDSTPYWNYETNDTLYFPVINSNKKLPKKELLFILPYENESYAFIRNSLIEEKKASIQVWDQTLSITYDSWIITAKIWEQVIPWYIEMFFSWATQHPGNENLWGVK